MPTGHRVSPDFKRQRAGNRRTASPSQNTQVDKLDLVYEHLWAGHGDQFDILDRSQNPRSWTFLFDIVREANLGPHSVVVDAGCGRGNHSFELTKRFACQSIGIDVVFEPLRTAAAARQNTTPGIHFVQAAIDQLPVRSDAVDLVWCRDMLVHIRPLQEAIRECSRILRPGGKMLAWTTVPLGCLSPAGKIKFRLLLSRKAEIRARLEVVEKHKSLQHCRLGSTNSKWSASQFLISMPCGNCVLDVARFVALASDSPVP